MVARILALMLCAPLLPLAADAQMTYRVRGSVYDNDGKQHGLASAIFTQVLKRQPKHACATLGAASGP